MASRVSSVIQRPAPRVGVRMALDGQVGTRGVPVRSALVGAGVAAAALIGAAVFVSSTTEAIDDPAAYGWVWDTKPEIISNDDPIAMVTDIISSDEIVAAGDARCGQLEVDGLIRTACALTPVKGSMQLRVADGRPPAGPSEVALGSRVLDDLGVGIGDRVTLTGVEGSDFETIVVGQAVGPLTDARIPGETLHVSPELFAALLPADVVGEFTGRFVPFRYADGVDAAGFEDELERSYALDFTSDSYAEPPSLLSLLDEMRWLFVASAAFLGVIGAVGLTHFLVVSVRRRRPDFGVLRAMGLRRPDVRHAVSWQAAAATGVGVAIGAPLGVVLGRSAWQIVVADLGLAAEPTSAGWAVVGVVLVSVAGAAVLAIGPGWLAARPSPAESLRSE